MEKVFYKIYDGKSDSDRDRDRDNRECNGITDEILNVAAASTHKTSIIMYVPFIHAIAIAIAIPIAIAIAVQS